MQVDLFTASSLALLVVCLIPLAYMYLLALGSVRPARRVATRRTPTTRFAITVPAHDEDTVIAASVRRLRELDYPPDLFTVHVVADHCSDKTARLAREAGAEVHERNEGPRSGKGAALSWLFERVLARDYDAVVVFDADTRVDRSFLRIMDAKLAGGATAIQGQHIISNPEAGWFPSLTWAMFLIDNRFQNLGRSNLGLSAKHMGDSICFAAAVLRKHGVGDGLTEDFQLRQRLLLDDVLIEYEPAAKGLGEAPPTWSQARTQRARWLRGVHDASKESGNALIAAARQRRNPALIDGVLQAYLPSFSTVALISVVLLGVQFGLNILLGPVFATELLLGWALVVGLLFVYPLLGLALEHAPPRAYQAILLGPFFVVWRSWLASVARHGRRPIHWIRTAHGGRSS